MALFSSSACIPPTLRDAYLLAASLFVGGTREVSFTAGPPTSSTTFTLQWWWKTHTISSGYRLFGSSGADALQVLFNSSNGDIRLHWSNTITTAFATAALFRDHTAWQHCCLRVDTTQPTAADRIRFYVNAIEAEKTSASYPSQNAATTWNSAIAHHIGQSGGTEFNVAVPSNHDGQSYEPTMFVELDQNGVLVPRSFASEATFGANGWLLDFNDPTSTATLGHDVSGNANHWTLANFTTADAHKDIPVNDTDNDAGNTAVLLNHNNSYATLSNGNRTSTGNSSIDSGSAHASFALTSGKWAWQTTWDTVASGYPQDGVVEPTAVRFTNGARSAPGNGHQNYGYANGFGLRSDGNVFDDGTLSVLNVGSRASGDVMTWLLDMDHGAAYLSINGTIQNAGVPTSGASKTGAIYTWPAGTKAYVPAVSNYNGSVTTHNFGQTAFSHAVAAGYNPVTAAHVPEPLIAAPAQHFKVHTYSGNGTNPRNVTGVGFDPDLVITKNLGSVTNPLWLDRLRGDNAVLVSEGSDAEFDTSAGTPSSGFPSGLISDGFQLDAGNANDLNVNASGSDYVAYCFKAGGPGTANGNGSIASTVSANTAAGFSIVAYTGTGTDGTVGHGLDDAPELVIIKNRDQADSWAVMVVPYSNAVVGSLEQTAAFAGSRSDWFQDTDPTPTVVSIGTNHTVNAVGEDYVMYCFHSSDVFDIGVYNGNGSADGPPVWANHTTDMLLQKRVDGVGPWSVWSWALGSNRNPIDKNFHLDNTIALTAEGNAFDFLAGGVKARASGGNMNADGGVYVYLSATETGAFRTARAR